MSMQSFRFIRLVDKKLGEEVGEESSPSETNEQSISCFLGILPTVLGFSTIKKESLNSASSYQKNSKILISVAAIITRLTEK